MDGRIKVGDYTYGQPVTIIWGKWMAHTGSVVAYLEGTKEYLIKLDVLNGLKISLNAKAFAATINENRKAFPPLSLVNPQPTISIEHRITFKDHEIICNNKELRELKNLITGVMS